jgi:hypothetical protein
MKENQTSLERCKTKVLGGRDGAFGWHSPYVAEYSHGSTVALFRKPKARLISAFLFEGGMMILLTRLIIQSSSSTSETRPIRS